MCKIVYILGEGASRELWFKSTSFDINRAEESRFKLNGPLGNGFFYDSDLPPES